LGPRFVKVGKYYRVGLRGEGRDVRIFERGRVQFEKPTLSENRRGKEGGGETRRGRKPVVRKAIVEC